MTVVLDDDKLNDYTVSGKEVKQEEEEEEEEKSGSAKEAAVRELPFMNKLREELSCVKDIQVDLLRSRKARIELSIS